MWAILADGLAGMVGGAVGALVGMGLAKAMGRTGENAKMIRLVPAVACLVVALQVSHAIDAAEWLEIRFSGMQPWQLIMWREAKPMTKHPAFARRTAATGSAAGQGAVAVIVHAGLRRLSAAELETWARIELDLAEASPPFCAAMWTGDVEGRRLIGDVIAKLPEAKQVAWARLSGHAGLLELDQNPDGKAEPPPDLEPGLRAILKTLDQAQSDAFERDMQSPRLEPARACELMKTVLRAIPKLEPAARADFLRALASI